LKEDIRTSLDRDRFVVFHGYARTVDDLPAVYWDTERYPDHEDFLKSAKAVGVSMIVFHQQEFTGAMVEDAMDSLESGDVSADDYRLIKGRLEELRRYDGFTCTMELSFDYQGRAYIYELRSEWFDEYSEILEELEFGMSGDKEEGADPMGGYFSKN
jgi:hypothetical protein